MASACYSCRTSAFRTFVRSVAQLHLPGDNLARKAPWLETRRQLHQRGAARWPATAIPPSRSIRTAAKDAGSAAVESEHAQGRDGVQDGETPMHAASDDLVAEEEKLFGAKPMRIRETVERQPEANSALPTDTQTSEDLQTYDEIMKDMEGETFSIEEIEAEQEKRELNRLRVRAERAKAREQAKKEQEKQKEEERKQREKARMEARPDWAAQKAALKEKFPEGWRPRKKLSPDAQNGIRVLHKQFPETYTTTVLANKFEVSPEAIRRILRSKWEPSQEEEEERERRWHNRGVNIWQHYAAIGKKPPVKWRQAGVAMPPRRGRDRRESESYDGYGESMEEANDDSAELEQKKRFRRQQSLAKHLV